LGETRGLASHGRPSPFIDLVMRDVIGIEIQLIAWRGSSR
jgi:hypothetical protein